MIPLSDGAGDVVTIGPGVTRFKVGDRVAGAFFPGWLGGAPSAEAISRALGGSVDGMLAETVVLHETGAIGIPEQMSFEEGATLPCAGLTAWNAVAEMATVRAGETVLLLGTGGVSLFALQFAKLHGACAILTSSSNDKLALAKTLGADQTINYRETPEWHKKVAELTGGRGVRSRGRGRRRRHARALDPFDAGWRRHRLNRRRGGTGQIDPRLLMSRAARLQGIFVGSLEMFAAMNAALTQAKLRPVIDRVFPFQEAREAYAYLDFGQAHRQGRHCRLTGQRQESRTTTVSQWSRKATCCGRPAPSGPPTPTSRNSYDGSKSGADFSFASYELLWRWSVSETEAFWGALWDYFDIKSSVPYERVLASGAMPGARWFPAVRLNYAEHVLRCERPGADALLFVQEDAAPAGVLWDDFASAVRIVATQLRALGVKRGDRVAAYAPNIPETMIAMLATAAIGAVWAGCSPDFGSRGVLDRLDQLRPKALFCVGGYRYGGKHFDRREELRGIVAGLSGLRTRNRHVPPWPARRTRSAGGCSEVGEFSSITRRSPEVISPSSRFRSIIRSGSSFRLARQGCRSRSCTVTGASFWRR